MRPIRLHSFLLVPGGITGLDEEPVFESHAQVQTSASGDTEHLVAFGQRPIRLHCFCREYKALLLLADSVGNYSVGAFPPPLLGHSPLFLYAFTATEDNAHADAVSGIRCGDGCGRVFASLHHLVAAHPSDDESRRPRLDFEFGPVLASLGAAVAQLSNPATLLHQKTTIFADLKTAIPLWRLEMWADGGDAFLGSYGFRREVMTRKCFCSCLQHCSAARADRSSEGSASTAMTYAFPQLQLLDRRFLSRLSSRAAHFRLPGKAVEVVIFICQLSVWRAQHLAYARAGETRHPHPLSCPRHDRRPTLDCYGCEIAGADALRTTRIEALDVLYIVMGANTSSAEDHARKTEHAELIDGMAADLEFLVHFERLLRGGPDCSCDRGWRKWTEGVPPDPTTPQLLEWARRCFRAKARKTVEHAVLSYQRGDFTVSAMTIIDPNSDVKDPASEDIAEGIFYERKHYHHCCLSTCPTVANRPSTRDEATYRTLLNSATAKDSYKACRLCVAQHLRVKHFYCSSECAAADWPRHRRLHQLFVLRAQPTLRGDAEETYRLVEVELERRQKEEERLARAKNAKPWKTSKRKKKKNPVF